jgi:hypothetical protein
MLTLDANVAIVALRGIAMRAANDRPILQQIGEAQAAKVMLGIMSDKDDPEGQAWAEWRPSTEKSRQGKGNSALGLLWDQGTLLGSIRVQTGIHQVEIGTRMKEGLFLQEGTARMEARPWLGWSDSDAESAEAMYSAYILGSP